MRMHWHWLIVIYLFLGGLGAGAYLTSFAAEKGWLGPSSSLKRAGYYLAAPIVAIGTLLLVFDLGQGLYKPWLLIGLLSNLSSVMTWGVYILSFFIIIGLIKGFLVFKNKNAPAVLTWAGAILALATGAYTGILLAVVEAVPFWNTAIMPVLFVVSALSTGLSATALLALLIEKQVSQQVREGQAHLLLIVAELVIAALFFGLMLTGIKGTVGIESAAIVVSGAYSVVFWGYFIGLGLLFPLIVFILQQRSFKQTAKKTVSEPSVISSRLHIFADISVLLGGLALRGLIVFAALPVWDGFTLFL